MKGSFSAVGFVAVLAFFFAASASAAPWDFRTYDYCNRSSALADGSLEVVTYNIKSGLQPGGGMEAVVETLRDLHFDVVALQEVEVGTIRTDFMDQADFIAEKLGLCGVFFASMNFSIFETFGNAILSHAPLVSYEAYRLPAGFSLKFKEPRSVLHAAIPLASGNSVHILTSHFPLFADDRLRASRFIRKQFAPLTGERVVLLGDLNEDPFGPAMLELSRPGKLTFTQTLTALGREPIPTFPSTGPSVQIDHVFVHGPMVPLDLSAVASVASDHVPFYASFRW